MVVIISIEIDHSTDMVCDWLYSMNIPFFRINYGRENNLLFSNEFDSQTNHFSLTDTIFSKNLNFKEVKSVWYRRMALHPYNHQMFNDNEDLSFQFKERALKYCVNEYTLFKKRITSLLDINNPLWLDYPDKTNKYNKLDILEMAKASGLNIPKTLISNNIYSINKFIKENGSVITKPLYETSVFENNRDVYTIYTEEITSEIENNQKIIPSLFQKNIKKRYEIRTFFLAGKIYSMAIFSAQNKKTETDFRRYDRNNPNRCIPYLLPKKIQTKIITFMKKNGLKTGSLDFIKSEEDNKYYFLEINPVGQFGMISIPCRYNLEKEMAIYLSNKNER